MRQLIGLLVLQQLLLIYAAQAQGQQPAQVQTLSPLLMLQEQKPRDEPTAVLPWRAQREQRELQIMQSIANSTNKGTDPALIAVLAQIAANSNKPTTDPNVLNALNNIANQQAALLQTMQSIVKLPVQGQPLQQLPIQGQPLQQLPVAGNVLQVLDPTGSPRLILQVPGQPLQLLPVAPPSVGTQPQQTLPVQPVAPLQTQPQPTVPLPAQPISPLPVQPALPVQPPQQVAPLQVTPGTTSNSTNSYSRITSYQGSQP